MAIGKAKEYIYIKQKLFISNMGEGAAKNRVSEAIVQSAQPAIESGRPFRIYIVIPTLVEVDAVAYCTI